MRASTSNFVPPHSIEAEQAVLGGLMLDNDAIDKISSLRSEHFYRQDHGAIFSEIIRCISAGRPADVVSIWEGLQARERDIVEGLLPYLNQLAQNTPSAANVRAYAEIVLDRAMLRDLLLVTGKASEMAHRPKGKTAGQVLDDVQSMVSTLAERRSQSAPKMISDLLIEFVEGASKRSEGQDSAISTGITAIDKVLNGGVRAGQLIVIAGRPSMGKTALAAHLGLNIAEQHSVLMFSMEMGGQEIAGRSLANRGNIHLSKVMGKIDEHDDTSWNSVTLGCGLLQRMRFAVDETPAITLLDLRIKAKAWMRRHSLNVIIVDYLGLMTGGDGDKRYEQIGSYSRGLKALAKELNIAIIALAQLNRKSEDRGDRKPILSDLRDSGEIEQDADVVAFVHRPEMHDPNNGLLHGYAEVLIRKQRNGVLCDIPMFFDGPTCAFSEWQGERPVLAVLSPAQHRGYN